MTADTLTPIIRTRRFPEVPLVVANERSSRMLPTTRRRFTASEGYKLSYERDVADMPVHTDRDRLRTTAETALRSGDLWEAGWCMGLLDRLAELKVIA